MHHSHSLSFLALFLLGFVSTTYAAPMKAVIPTTLETRQSITTPLGINITDINAGEISPIEDGFLELDNDSGDGNDNGSSGASVANGVGTVGTGQAAQNGNGAEGSTTSCGTRLF